MSHSVRLLWIGWLKRVRNKFSKHPVEQVRGFYAHPQTGCNLDSTRIAELNYAAAQSQINASLDGAHLQDQINKFNNLAGVHNLPSLVAQLQGATAPNHHLISHQNSSQNGNLDLSGQLHKRRAA